MVKLPPPLPTEIRVKRLEATWVTLQPLEERKYFTKIGKDFS